MESSNPSRGASGRLGSWKEIALYFSKDVRTVKRWEKERALPVHRAPGKPGGSVYAFTDELSDWLNSSSDKLEENADAGSTKSAPRTGILIIACVVLIVAIVVGVIWVIHSRSAATTKTATSTGAPTSSNPEAVDLYLKGRFEWSKRSPDSLNKAVDFFTQAIVRDPNYAQAYAGLADTYNLLREYAAMPVQDAYPRSIAAAKKAVELDDTLSEAHRALAFATFHWLWNFAEGEREFKRAIELNPKDAVAHHWYGSAIASVGRISEGLSELELARQIDPTSVSIQADRAYFICLDHREDEGIPLLKQIETADPNFISPHRYLAYFAVARGDYQTYLAESRKAVELAHDEIGLEILKAAERGFKAGGGMEMLNGIRQVQEKYHAQGLFPGTLAAEISALSGRNQEAIHYLEEDFKKHDPAIIGVPSDLALRSLHKDPGFRDLMARVGFAPLD
jgi:tetratricopeptide (TPR) repeat protein